jgi:signal transduction histidine kinase
MTTLSPEPIKIEKIIHDLRGPLFNIAGFQSELQDSFRQLSEMIELYCDNLSDTKKEEFRQIFEDDIDPCMTYTSKSIESLSERVDELEQRFKSDF